MKHLTLSLAFLGSLASVYAQSQPYSIGKEKVVTEEELIRRGDKLKAYRIVPDIGEAEQVSPDTITEGFYKRITPEARSLAMGYLGNLHAPWHNKMYFDRPPESPLFPFNNVLSGLLYTPANSLFYDTKTPYTGLMYLRHGSADVREEQLAVNFATNLGKQLNIGADMDYTYSNGYYSSSRTKNVNYRLFGSFRSDHYEAFVSMANNYSNITENGGIADATYITNPDRHGSTRGEIDSRDIPVRIPGAVLFNRLRSGSLLLSHRYNFGYRKKIKGEKGKPGTDSFIPVAGIVHYMTYEKGSRRFIGKPFDWGKIYPRHFIEHRSEKDTIVAPNDTCNMWSINNTIAITLREGFRPWVKFGLSAYARLENRHFYTMDSIPGVKRPEAGEFSFFVGSTISRTAGKGLNFRARAEFSLLGNDIGALRLDGEIKSSFLLFGHRMALSARGDLSNLKPSYLIRHHHGTFHWQDNDFGFVRRLSFGATASSELLGLSLQARSATLQNLLYFDENSLPRQLSDAVQITELRAKLAKRIGIFAYELEAAYQLTTDERAVPLPTLAAYANAGIDVLLFKVLRLQAGLDAHYHTAYNVPGYDPSIQQFVNRRSIKTGGKEPIMNIYVNAHLKRTRFFILWYNAGEILFRPYRFTLPHYPNNPPGLRIGLAVDFNN